MNSIDKKIETIAEIKEVIYKYELICQEEEKNGKLLFRPSESIVIFEIKQLLMDRMGQYACEKIMDEVVAADDRQLVEVDWVLYSIWKILIDLQSTMVDIIENPERQIGIKIYVCQHEALLKIKEKIYFFSIRTG